MDRRQFLQSVTAAATVGFLPPRLAWALRSSDTWQQAFAAALAQHPWLLGWRTVSDEALHTPRLEQQGTIPAGLSGTLYRNGPARHELGGERYQHWFDGDGMVQMFHVTPHGVTHHGRFVQTAKYTQETQDGKFVQRAFGTVPEASTPPSSTGALNPASPSVLVHAGKLFALWEGSDAYHLEPYTLETLGLQTWRPDLVGLPFSAHPKVEPDGTLWNFGLECRPGRFSALPYCPGWHAGQGWHRQGRPCGDAARFCGDNTPPGLCVAPPRWSTSGRWPKPARRFLTPMSGVPSEAPVCWLSTRTIFGKRAGTSCRRISIFILAMPGRRRMAPCTLTIAGPRILP